MTMHIPRINRINMNPIRCTIQRRSSCEIRYGAFRRAVNRSVSAADETVDGSGVEDPAAVAGRLEGFLGDHLFGGVFDSVVDAVDVDGDHFVEDVEGHVPDWLGVAGFEGEAGVVLQTLAFLRSGILDVFQRCSGEWSTYDHDI